MLSKEELRKARLLALGISDVSNQQPTSNIIQSSSTPTISIPDQRNVSSPLDNSASGSSYTLNEIEFERLVKLIYKNGPATDEDLLRWNIDGFQFFRESNYFLKQEKGGPCGILAVVQAVILKNLLFDENGLPRFSELPSIDNQMSKDALIEAFVEVLIRSSESNRVIIVDPLTDDYDQIPLGYWDRNNFVLHQFNDQNILKEKLVQLSAKYQSPAGCLLFLLSLVLTRGTSEINNEMDDPDSTLIGQFGHCTQELMNLLLTGKATSNVFDGDMFIHEMKVKGILAQADVGYLTQLESYQYCQVGSYLKVPKYPIWVIGSTSHFTVLFSLQSEINQESYSEKLLTLLRRAFKSVENDECGFISSNGLKEALEAVNSNNLFDNSTLQAIISNPIELARLRGHLQIDGEIILWQTFWVNLSQILTGKSLDSLIECEIISESKMDVVDPIIPPSSRPRSDSDVARELQAQFDADENSGAPQVQLENQNRVRSDSEMARELQAMWDAEDQPNPPVSANQPILVAETPQRNASQQTVPIESENVILAPREESAPEAILYHFNGLHDSNRPGNLSKFTLIRRASDNSIGQAVPLRNESQHSSGSCHIEDILRTRWLGCKLVFNGDNKPTID